MDYDYDESKEKINKESNNNNVKDDFKSSNSIKIEKSVEYNIKSNNTKN